MLFLCNVLFSGTILCPIQSYNLKNIIIQEATKCVGVEEIEAIIRVESSYKVDAVNLNKDKTVDIGLTQINSINIKDKKELYMLMNNPRMQVRKGLSILCSFKRRYGVIGILIYNVGHRPLLEGSKALKAARDYKRALCGSKNKWFKRTLRICSVSI